MNDESICMFNIKNHFANLQSFWDSRFKTLRKTVWIPIQDSRFKILRSTFRIPSLESWWGKSGFKKFYQNLESWTLDWDRILNLESRKLCKLCNVLWTQYFTFKFHLCQIILYGPSNSYIKHHFGKRSSNI